MTRDPLDETRSFSIGAILVKMKATTSEDVRRCLKAQMEDPESAPPLGEVLVQHGLVTEDQLDLALATQDGLRSKKKMIRAMAMAALAEISHEKVVQLAETIREKSRENVRRTTSGGYPVVKPDK